MQVGNMSHRVADLCNFWKSAAAAILVAGLLAASAFAQQAGQKTFASPEEASKAFYSAVKGNDEKAMLDVLGQDFIRTARAKGLTRRRALLKHGLRTALIPMATLFAYGISGLVTGAVFVEKIFGWHGIGEWAVQGVATQDTNITVAVTLFAGAMVLVGGLLSDVIYGLLDPRVRV